MRELINNWRGVLRGRHRHDLCVGAARRADSDITKVSIRARFKRPYSDLSRTPVLAPPTLLSSAASVTAAKNSTASTGTSASGERRPRNNGAAGFTGPPASGAVLNRSLVAALAEQFQRESLPWIQDLVLPLFEGPPQPLTGTAPPEMLADRDSRFATVQGVRIHYKMALPGEREGMRAAARAAAAARPTATSTATTAAAASVSSRPQGSSRRSLVLPASVLGSPPPTAASGPSSQQQSVSDSDSDRSVDAPTLSPNPDAAPTLLLLHGLNGSTFSWRLLMDDLAAYVSPATGGCRVVAYDRPPYGLSQRPLSWQREEDNPYTAEGGARLAAGLMDELLGPLPASSVGYSSSSSSSSNASSSRGSSRLGGVAGGGGGQVVLVGHSAGAAVAVETALRYPERVCGLVLIAPAITTDSRGFLARADLGQLLRFAWTRALLSADGPGLNYVRRQVMKRKAEVEAGRLGIYVDEREVPQEVIDGYLRPLRTPDWDKGTLLVYRSLQVSGAPPPLERIRVPVLVLQGREDRTVPLQTAQAVAEVLRRRRGPGAVTELRVLERCGHVPMDEQPLEVLAAVVDFVNRNCCGSPQAAHQQPRTAPAAQPSSASRGAVAAAPHSTWRQT